MNGNELSTLEFQREVIDRLARIETDARRTRDAFETHVAEDDSADVRLQTTLVELRVAQAKQAAKAGRRSGAIAGGALSAFLVAAGEAIRRWMGGG